LGTLEHKCIWASSAGNHGTDALANAIQIAKVELIDDVVLFLLPHAVIFLIYFSGSMEILDECFHHGKTEWAYIHFFRLLSPAFCTVDPFLNDNFV
jgi:hypothetical protein